MSRIDALNGRTRRRPDSIETEFAKHRGSFDIALVRRIESARRSAKLAPRELSIHFDRCHIFVGELRVQRVSDVEVFAR
jgi:hypothetical protein